MNVVGNASRTISDCKGKENESAVTCDDRTQVVVVPFSPIHEFTVLEHMR